MGLVDKIMDFESGKLDDNGVLELFSELIKTGKAWTLQGSYGRMAKHLIDEEFIDPQGKILRSP